jgi:SAM-dependent methyltransferase
MLPDMPLIDDYVKAEELGTEFIWPIRVFLCLGCGHAQTLHDINERQYYDDYQYSPSLSPFTQNFMSRLAETIWKKYDLRPGDTVVEVGSSDGGQLSYFKKLGAKVLGFELSTPLAEKARQRDIPVVQHEFGPGAASLVPAELLPVQVIVTTYTFDHMPDPLGFLESAAKVLDPERGLLVIEVHDLETIIERREFCLFAHEHPGYYSPATMQMVMRRAGFDLIDVNFIPEAERRGNSLLVVGALRGSRWSAAAVPSISIETSEIEKTCVEFGKSVSTSLEGLRTLVQQKRDAGLRLAGYGAGGRGVMTLAAMGRRDQFEYVCDKNESFHERYTPGSHLPIRPPEYLLDNPVDEVIVFSFGYFDEIAQELREFTARGGKLTSLLDIL